MAYRVVFTNGEKRELIIEAESVGYESASSMMVFKDPAGHKIALVPVDRVLYIKSTSDHG